MRNLVLFSAIYFISLSVITGQKNVTNFIFGNSLIHHEFQSIPTPSQETSVPYWIKELSLISGYKYNVAGQYGFLPQHATLPPISQWGFDNIEGAWESDYDPFSEALFTDILITPGNFIQFQNPSENYPYENVSPISATRDIIEWCTEQQVGLDFFIYENWPDMAEFLSNGFPPTESEWQSYNDYLNADFHDWFEEYTTTLKNNLPESCIRMIPTGTAISQLLQSSPYNEIPISELYEDDAPHGRATIYFLASLVTYMELYEEKAPTNYSVEDIIHPLIRDNYLDVVDFLWAYLVQYDEDNPWDNEFCARLTKTDDVILSSSDNLEFYPNPVENILNIKIDRYISKIELHTMYGKLCYSKNYESPKNIRIDMSDLSNGVYILTTYNSAGVMSLSKKVIKL